MSFLPGMFPGGAISKKGPLEITQVGLATSTSATITKPSVEVGDLLVLWEARTGTAGSSPPSGFTSIVNGNYSVGTGGHVLSYRIVDGSEGASFTGLGATTNKAMYVFRGNRPIQSVVVGYTALRAAAGSIPGAQAVASGGAVAPVIVIGVHLRTNGSVSLVNSMSPAADGGTGQLAGPSSGNPLIAMNYKIFNDTPANVTVSQSTSTSTINQAMGSCYIECVG